MTSLRAHHLDISTADSSGCLKLQLSIYGENVCAYNTIYPWNHRVWHDKVHLKELGSWTLQQWHFLNNWQIPQANNSSQEMRPIKETYLSWTWWSLLKGIAYTIFSYKTYIVFTLEISTMWLMNCYNLQDPKQKH